MANKLYAIEETAITFGGAVGDDVAWSWEAITDTNGRQSALHDLGARTTAKSNRYKFRFFTQLQVTPTLGEPIDLYLKTSDGTNPDNDDGTGDAALSADDKLKNLRFINTMLVDEAAASIVTVLSGILHEVNERHIAFVGSNNSGATINATDSNSQLSLWPMPDEVQ